MNEKTIPVRLRPGERHVLRLPGLGTVGYSWHCRVEGDPDTVAVSVTTAPASEIVGAPIGTSLDTLATLEARGPGRATVHLEQRRAWEDKPPLEHRILDVTVD